MLNLNSNQLLAIGIGAASFIGGATGNLQILLGTNGAAYVTAACSLVAGIMAVIMTVTTGQGSTIKQVLAMPGVEKINVNAAANQTLSQLAVDPNVDKIGPTPAAAQQVEQTAKGT